MKYPFRKYPDYLKKKIEEKKEIESAVLKISTKIKELSNIQEEKEQEIERLSKIAETMTKTYKTFMIAKIELKQYGIGMDDMNMFVKSVVGISKENYDPVQILAKIADYENLEKNSRNYKEQIQLMKDELTKLNQDIDREQKVP